MALRPCNECKYSISDKAVLCPHCGAPVDTTPAVRAAKSKNIEPFIFAAIAVISLIIYAVYNFANGTLQARPPSASTPSTSLVLPSEARHVHQGYPVCDTKDHLDQFGLAMRNRDWTAMNYMFERTCTMTEEGEEISVLDTGFTLWVQIRIYRASGPIEGFTYAEALAR